MFLQKKKKSGKKSGKKGKKKKKEKDLTADRFVQQFYNEMQYLQFSFVFFIFLDFACEFSLISPKKRNSLVLAIHWFGIF